MTKCRHGVSILQFECLLFQQKINYNGIIPCCVDKDANSNLTKTRFLLSVLSFRIYIFFLSFPFFYFCLFFISGRDTNVLICVKRRYAMCLRKLGKLKEAVKMFRDVSLFFSQVLIFKNCMNLINVLFCFLRFQGFFFLSFFFCFYLRSDGSRDKIV